MFRRFMIVCWVLFGLTALPAIVSGAMLMSDKSKMLSLRSEVTEAEGITSTYGVHKEIRKEVALAKAALRRRDAETDDKQNRQDFTIEELTVARDRALEKGDDALADRISERISFKQRLEAARGFSTDDIDRLAETDRSELEKRSQEASERLATANAIHEREEVLTVVAGMSAIAAVIILLWNIVCHVGHWIWMGRQ